MTRRLLVMFGVVGLIAAMTPTAVARPEGSSVELTTAGTDRTLTLPAAAANSNVISLGTAIDPGSGRKVEGYAIVHYRPEFARGGKPGRPGGGGGGSSCYAYLSKGAKWKSTEPYLFNTTNTAGLGDVSGSLAADIDKWEAAAGHDIFGVGSTTSNPLKADSTRPNGVNEVYFGDVANPGAIAVTIVWGIFSGPPRGRELVEWDQVYDQADYDWSLNGTGETMGFDNIATHEVGHAAGMGHPDDACTEETMYRFASTGESKKSSLNAGDIAGISGLYP